MQHTVKEESAGTRLNFTTMFLTLTWTTNVQNWRQLSKSWNEAQFKECKVLRLNSKSKAKPNSQTSKAEADFTYLYANVTKDSGGTDIMKRISMAGASFISPANIKKVTDYQWKDQSIYLLEPGPVCNVVLMWDFVAYHTKEKRTDAFQTKCLRKILMSRWQQHTVVSLIFKGINFLE